MGKNKTKKERPYEYLFYAQIADLPLDGHTRESFKQFWESVNRIYDRLEPRIKEEGRRLGALDFQNSAEFRKLLSQAQATELKAFKAEQKKRLEMYNEDCWDKVAYCIRQIDIRLKELVGGKK